MAIDTSPTPACSNRKLAEDRGREVNPANAQLAKLEGAEAACERDRHIVARRDPQQPNQNVVTRLGLQALKAASRQLPIGAMTLTHAHMRTVAQPRPARRG